MKFGVAAAPLPLILPLLLACSAGASQSGARGGDSVTPVNKVIEMLNAMKQKGQQEKHNEEVAFGKFAVFCKVTSEAKAKYIKEAADKIVELEADIVKAEADADKLGEDITNLDNDMTAYAAQGKKATAVRDKEYQLYSVEHADYVESIDAIERAIQVLKAKSQSTPEVAPELIALSKLPQLPPTERHALRSFLQEGDSTQAVASGAPAANAYEFQSSDIIEMLEKLRGRFQDEKLVLEKEEMNRKHNYNLLMQDLSDNTEYAEKTKSEKVELKAKRLKDAAEAKGDLAETQEGKASDEAYLQDLTATCHQKSSEYEQRQVLRAKEIEAIGKAIEIISSPDVAGMADKHLPTMLQTTVNSSAPKLALVQLRSSNMESKATPLQKKVAAFLLKRAQASKSGFLEALAGRVSKEAFAKVIKMIKDLIVKLMEEANDEAEHKAWCDKELGTNKQSRDDLSAAVDTLTQQIDELTALTNKLTEEIADLGEAIKSINEAMKSATEERQEEKAENLATIADSKQAQAAVQQAITILKEFYMNAGEATALVQQKKQVPEGDLPTTWDSAYTGMQGDKGGVVGMLEVIQSDFARVEASTSSEEDEAARQYKDFMQDSEVDKAVKEKEMRHKGFKKTRTDRAINEAKKDLEATQTQLDAALAYYEKLKPACVDLGVSYEDRVKRREEEIQSLQEALKILNGEEIAA